MSFFIVPFFWPVASMYGVSEKEGHHKGPFFLTFSGEPPLRVFVSEEQRNRSFFSSGLSDSEQVELALDRRVFLIKSLISLPDFPLPLYQGHQRDGPPPSFHHQIPAMTYTKDNWLDCASTAKYSLSPLLLLLGEVDFDLTSRPLR